MAWLRLALAGEYLLLWSWALALLTGPWGLGTGTAVFECVIMIGGMGNSPDIDIAGRGCTSCKKEWNMLHSDFLAGVILYKA